MYKNEFKLSCHVSRFYVLPQNANTLSKLKIFSTNKPTWTIKSLSTLQRINNSKSTALYCLWRTPNRHHYSNKPMKEYLFKSKKFKIDGWRWRSRNSETNLMKALLGPPEKNPRRIGQGAVALCSALGISTLCYYGLLLTKSEDKIPSALNKYSRWQDYIKERLRTTFGYFSASIVCTGMSARTAFKSPFFMRLLVTNPVLMLIATVATQIVSGIIVLHTHYTPGIGFKQIAWIIHTCIMGCTIAPMCYIGGPILIRAFFLTAGVIGALSTIAFCSPDQRFLTWSGPLAIALGCVLASSIGSFFLPPSTKLGLNLFSFYLYGGLIIFSAMLLYDTQKVIRMAERIDPKDPIGYDPINAAMSLYFDALNIFVRIIQLLALQQVRKRSQD